MSCSRWNFLVEDHADPAVGGDARAGLDDEQVIAGRKLFAVPGVGDVAEDRRGRAGDFVDSRDLFFELLDGVRICPAQNRSCRWGKSRSLPLVRRELHLEMTRDGGRVDRLIEAQADDDCSVEATSLAVPGGREQADRRSREGENVRLRERVACERRCSSIDDDFVTCRARQRLFGIGRENECRRARPSERSRHGRRDSEEGDGQAIGNPSERDHRL